MDDIGVVGLIIIVANFLVSYKGFKDFTFIDKYKFEVDKILVEKDYKRLVTSGFLHVNWMHLIFNMISLYAFSGLLEFKVGSLFFALIYFTSLIAGNLFALFIHKNHGDYSAVGASGAVSGVIFASIALFPGLGIGFIILPISIPSWLFGILYVGYSIYGIKSQRDNIGHEAHLGGALVGMLVAILLYPNAISENYLPILLILVPTIIFIYFIIKSPEILLIDNFFFKNKKKHYNVEHKYNEQKVNKEKELNKILDKINKKGIDSLTKKERKKLEELSKS